MTDAIQHIKKIIFGVLIIVGMSGCLPFEQELQLMLDQHNISKKIYIKNDTIGYDKYTKNKKTLSSLRRGEQFTIINIKAGYAQLAKSKNNQLKHDVWVSLRDLENTPTYFILLTTNAMNSKIIIEGQEYKNNMRVPQGKYKLEIDAERFLHKSLEMIISKDTTEKILLNFDIVAEKQRIRQVKKIAREKAKKAKITHEIKTSIYRDKQQKLTWQDNTDAIKIKKPWITQINYELKNYADTRGDTATTYCKKLSLAGFNDWSLPTKDQLKKLYKDKKILKNVSPNWYWSSTNSKNNEKRAWSIYLNNGDGYSDFKNTINHVRCVRQGS